jgi:hypothetical protein
MSSLPNLLATGLDETSFTSFIIILVGLIILWGLISIPIYIAAKVVTGGKASFPAAMGATLLGPIVYSLTMLFASFFLSAVIGLALGPLALAIAFIAWLAVYKSSFSTGWLGALFIAILAAIIFAIISLFVVSILGNTVPGRFFDLASF